MVGGMFRKRVMDTGYFGTSSVKSDGYVTRPNFISPSDWQRIVSGINQLWEMAGPNGSIVASSGNIHEASVVSFYRDGYGIIVNFIGDAVTSVNASRTTKNGRQVTPLASLWANTSLSVICRKPCDRTTYSV
jgi:hypothetical protein